MDEKEREQKNTKRESKKKETTKSKIKIERVSSRQIAYLRVVREEEERRSTSWIEAPAKDFGVRDCVCLCVCV